MSDKAICVKGGGGLLLPLFGDGEQELPRALRVVMYLVGLLWSFMGVGIIADVFMTAIEKVTSKKVRRFDKKKQRWYTFEVWNATVANLTLMALGSSAPEILLNVIDIFAKEFFLEGLGPSTIVGSAAFNLLMIIAVCIVAIPDGQVRYIKEMSVYICTASWSIFAYVWLIIILLVVSPHVVEVWEGVVTFLFFPILTFLAWLCDKGYIGGGKSDKKFKVTENMSEEELAEVYAELRKEHGAALTDDRAQRMLLAMGAKPRSRAQYRVNASRSLFGGKRTNLSGGLMGMTRSLSFIGRRSKVMPDDTPTPLCTFALPVLKAAVLESCGYVTVKIRRGGDGSFPAEVQYTTENGSAEAGDDFDLTAGWLKFEADEYEKEVKIKIHDDDAHEDDEHFFFKITAAKADEDRPVAIDEENSKMEIGIIDDDDAGILSFATETDEFAVQRQVVDSKIHIPVQRKMGGSGKITVKYYTEADSAQAGKDFTSCEGEIEFESAQVEASIEVTILGSARLDGYDRFRVFLTEPENGATLDKNRDGGEERNILTVIIGPDDNTKQNVDKLKSALGRKWEKSLVGHTNWASQFKEAIKVNGGGDDDDEGEGGSPSIMDYISHALCLPWKLLFACVPPTDYCGGWVCFFSALLAIGFVTMIINDMASLLGCTMCISDEITAITFVALGTSLPDTFASMTAATSEPYADSSVGNVTGSNSVNVFLGLGLPWMIAAIAWAVKGGTNAKWQARFQMDPDLTWLGAAGARDQAFVVKAGSLAFSVTVFSCCAVACIGLLAVRRIFCGGELGGGRLSKYMSSVTLVALWLLYIALSCWKSIEESGGGGCAK